MIRRRKGAAVSATAARTSAGRWRRNCDRIQARAVRRCGELALEIPASKGARTDLELQEGTLPRLTRTEAMTEAGLSEHQRKTALRVAAVPAEEFDCGREGGGAATAVGEPGRFIATRRRCRCPPDGRSGFRRPAGRVGGFLRCSDAVLARRQMMIAGATPID